MTSDAYEKFRYAFFDDPYSARDYLDVDTLRGLEDEDRKKAEQALLDFLPDLRAVIGLGLLRSQCAQSAIRAMFAAPAPLQCRSRDVEIAKALYLIAPAKEYVLYLCDVLRGSRDWLTRMEAALALAETPDAAAISALEAALDDRDHLVRHHAARALLKLHGLPADSNEPEDALYRIMSEDAFRREGGKRDVLAAIAGREMTRSSEGG